MGNQMPRRHFDRRQLMYRLAQAAVGGFAGYLTGQFLTQGQWTAAALTTAALVGAAVMAGRQPPAWVTGRVELDHVVREHLLWALALFVDKAGERTITIHDRSDAIRVSRQRYRGEDVWVITQINGQTAADVLNRNTNGGEMPYTSYLLRGRQLLAAEIVFPYRLNDFGWPVPDVPQPRGIRRLFRSHPHFTTGLRWCNDQEARQLATRVYEAAGAPDLSVDHT